MKINKILCIILGVLICFSTVPFDGQSKDAIHTEQENPIVKNRDCIAEQPDLTEEDTKLNDAQCYVMQTRSYQEVLAEGATEDHAKPELLTVPDEFSWINHNGEDWATSVKRQKCGDCWLFAAIGCLESIINIREDCPTLDPDLSEQYVLSCYPKAGSCRGGSSYKAFQYMLDDSWDGRYANGAITESCFRYVGIDSDGCDYSSCDNDPVYCSEKCDDWENFLVPLNDYGIWYPDGSQMDINRIKSQILEDGPVVTYYLANQQFSEWVSTHNNATDYFPYTGYIDEINHAVVLVGWKDDPSIGNGGYWIVKNSWGPSTGYNGFFNIEYGALGIDNVQISSVDYDPNDYDWEPIADLGGIYHGSVGETITFDATNSYDAEGDIASYHWDFGDGSTSDQQAPTHTYSERGMYVVGLTVTDESGKTGYQETNALIDFWKEGDSWTYDANINLELTDMIEGDVTIDITDFTLSVQQVTDEQYILGFNGKITGDFNLATSIFEFGGKIPRTIAIEGTITVDKDTLAIQQLTLDSKGRISIGKTPTSLLKLPIPYTVSTQVTLEDGLELFHLPLNEFTSMDLHPGNMEITGELSSFWLHVLNIMNKLTGKILLPPDIGSLLPVIDFSELFNELSLRSYPYTCTYYGEQTVEAGTFDTYELVVETTYSDAVRCAYYFTPEIDGITHLDVTLDEFNFVVGSISGNIHAELKSYTFE